MQTQKGERERVRYLWRGFPEQEISSVTAFYWQRRAARLMGRLEARASFERLHVIDLTLLAKLVRKSHYPPRRSRAWFYLRQEEVTKRVQEATQLVEL